MTQPAVDPLTLALELHRAGNTAEAEGMYRRIVAQDPGQADARHFLGVLCLQTGCAPEAVELIQSAIEIDPNNAEFYSHLGAAYGALERHDESVTSLRCAVQIAPRSASAHYNLGTALINAGQLENAVASFRHAIAADPQSAEAYYNLGNTLGELKQPAEAEASYREAIRIRPSYVKALVNLGNLLREKKRFDESIDVLRAAVSQAPNHANAVQNLGASLRDAGRVDEAIACLRRAVELDPRAAEAHNNLGTALQALGDYAAAGACYDRAVELDPDLGDAHFSRATFRLRQGDIAGGFAEYEWRWKCAGFSDRGFKQPRWDGSPLAGRVILLYAEQGLGDTLHFVRYAREAKRRGGHVIVECQPPLVKLLSHCHGVDRVIALGSSLPDFDVHAPLMSLPHILAISLENLPRDANSREPYLEANRELIDRWRDALAGYDGRRVGICWQGNRDYMFDHQRSFPLSQMAPLAQVGGARLFSLQKGPGREQIAAAPFEVIELAPPLDEAAGPFMDTAAVMRNLDVVVTSDTAVAHLAGALGVPVWTALSAHCDWRWMLDREDTPWYPTMRLFRQRRLNEWDDVFHRIAAELARKLDRPE